MIRSLIARGIAKAASRRSLILLLYLVGLGVAALLAVPVFRAVDTLFGSSGFSAELARRFDIVLWMDMLEKGGTALAGAMRQFFWAIPLFIVWKVASQVGLVYALKDDGQASFWEGVSRYTLRGLLLALIYLLLGGFAIAILWIILVLIIKGQGEPGQFWTAIVIGPILSIVILALFDLMHDYARMRLVLRRDGIWRSFLSGSFFPIRRLSALFLYKVWFLVGGVLWLLPFWLDGVFAKTTIAGMLGAFLVQQIVILTRHGATVAWIGSEVFYFEANAEALIEPADDAVSEGPGPDSVEPTGNGPKV
ncbi:MAG: hypothetical protein ACC655_10920 [Rhodothermia bacterium]